LEGVIRILIGIPLGVFVHRGWDKAILLYLYCFVGLYVACTVIDPTRAVESLLELPLSEFVISLLQFGFGVGTGILLSVCAKYLP